MPLAKVRENGQAALRRSSGVGSGLDSGDYAATERDGDRIALIPQTIAPRTPEIDAAIAERLANIRAGPVAPASASAEEFREWLDTVEGKKFAADK